MSASTLRLYTEITCTIEWNLSILENNLKKDDHYY